jgi:hypothetical protein
LSESRELGETHRQYLSGLAALVRNTPFVHENIEFAFILACKSKDIAVAKYMLENFTIKFNNNYLIEIIPFVENDFFTSIFEKSGLPCNDSLLRAACMAGKEDIFIHILEKAKNLFYAESVMCFALESGSLEMVKMVHKMMNKGPFPKTVDRIFSVNIRPVNVEFFRYILDNNLVSTRSFIIKDLVDRVVKNKELDDIFWILTSAVVGELASVYLFFFDIVMENNRIDLFPGLIDALCSHLLALERGIESKNVAEEKAAATKQYGIMKASVEDAMLKIFRSAARRGLAPFVKHMIDVASPVLAPSFGNVVLDAYSRGHIRVALTILDHTGGRIL